MVTGSTTTESLQCVRCGQDQNLWQLSPRCTACGGLLAVSRDLSEYDATMLRGAWAARRGSLAPHDRSGVWRFRELIAPLDLDEMTARGEGNTGLYPTEELARWAGVASLHLKHEGENPTGSFKDRGMTAGVSVARKLGARTVACASTGNTSASLASYAALAGLGCLVLVPAGEHTSAAKLSQALAYGARTLAIRGDFDRALVLLQALAPELDLYVLNSVNPWRLEGQKSIMFETLEALGWEAPDWIVLPGGNLGNTSAFTKALLEMRELGLIARLPRIAVVQAAGASPFAASYAGGWAPLQPVRADTMATAIRIGDPVNHPKASAGVRALDGVVTTVTDPEIMDAKALVDRAGIGCEPASAASIAGLRRLCKEGVIGAEERVVAVITGHLLKDPDASSRYHASAAEHANPPTEVDADERSIRAVVRGL
ncbi:MAG: threonine synthase [Chloroflexia bacterium]|nr:threonine synthase [Chloroflexia bacterium]